MTKNRLIQTIYLYTKKGDKRKTFFKKFFAGFGENVSYFPKVMPLYPELIKFHSNIVIASNVNFVTHDAIHVMLNKIRQSDTLFPEAIGCIEIMDNCFIGANTTILYGVRIGENCIVGAGSLVNKDLQSNSVYAGVPAKRIGSFDDYIAKRKLQNFASVEKSQCLTQYEIENAWKLFYSNHNK